MMTNKNTTNVLVLGANGMVGRVIFRYLQSLSKIRTFGTTRSRRNNNDTQFFFAVDHASEDFAEIIKKQKKIDYVINCIGITNDKKKLEELLFINASFPHQLEQLSDTYHFKLIHISTDGVFSDTANTVNESSTPSPENMYGKSKLLGETNSKNAITIRTSFVGFDPEKHHGILENALNKRNNFVGYSNHLWTGCTTLQFAKFCTDIINKNKFAVLREKSSVFHFAPLGPISKYELVKIFMRLVDPNCMIKEGSDKRRLRILETNFSAILGLNNYINNPENVLRQLIAFESAASTEDTSITS